MVINEATSEYKNITELSSDKWISTRFELHVSKDFMSIMNDVYLASKINKRSMNAEIKDWCKCARKMKAPIHILKEEKRRNDAAEKKRLDDENAQRETDKERKRDSERQNEQIREQDERCKKALDEYVKNGGKLDNVYEIELD